MREYRGNHQLIAIITQDGVEGYLLEHTSPIGQPVGTVRYSRNLHQWVINLPVRNNEFRWVPLHHDSVTSAMREFQIVLESMWSLDTEYANMANTQEHNAASANQAPAPDDPRSLRRARRFAIMRDRSRSPVRDRSRSPVREDRDEPPPPAPVV